MVPNLREPLDAETVYRVDLTNSTNIPSSPLTQRLHIRASDQPFPLLEIWLVVSCQNAVHLHGRQFLERRNIRRFVAVLASLPSELRSESGVLRHYDVADEPDDFSPVLQLIDDASVRVTGRVNDVETQSADVNGLAVRDHAIDFAGRQVESRRVWDRSIVGEFDALRVARARKDRSTSLSNRGGIPDMIVMAVRQQEPAYLVERDAPDLGACIGKFEFFGERSRVHYDVAFRPDHEIEIRVVCVGETVEEVDVG